MDKKSMIESLVMYYTQGNKSKFAARLGVTPQTINTWINRNTFDAELIFAKCEYVSGDWLLSGQGQMLRSDVEGKSSMSDTGTVLQLVDTIRQQAQEIGQLRERINQLESERGANVSDADSETVARAV